MSKREFKKGQKVNVYHGDFHTASVYVKTYTVASCGTKQLHLIRADGSNAEFRISAPFRGERRYSDVQCASVDPIQHAATLRRQFASWTREHYENRTAVANKQLAQHVIGAESYARAIAEARAKFEAATIDL